jgi:acyl-CoA synthetase (AMP-forming)/AMP-acid ligase II
VTFVDYLDRGARSNPNGTALVTEDGSFAITHAELEALSHRVAVALQERGWGPGTNIGVYSPNDPVAMACIIGILRAGCGWVALNPRGELDELSRLTELARCDLLIHHDAFTQRAEALLAGSNHMRDSLSFGAAGGEVAPWLASEGVRARRVDLSPEAPTMILGSGGTTGPPKAVAVSVRQMLVMCWAFDVHMPEPEPPVYLMATPMTHAAGGVAFPVLAEGGTVVVHDGVDAKAIFTSIERHRVTRIFLPPTAIYTLLAHPDVRAHSYSSLRHFVYAAAPMSADKLIDAMGVFGPVMTQTFGQAEAPMICTCFTPKDHAEALADPTKRSRLSSCGRPSVVATVEIMSDDGEILGPGERGEIVVRGDLVMGGYYDNPEATAETRRPGGWHGTSDVGYRDEAGFVFIVDRTKDMIISGGFNIYPSEIERVAWSHPAVLDCAVIGLPDEKWGEAVTAVVELRDGAEASAEDLIQVCKRELGSIRAPKAVIFRELPRSSNGKVLKRVLRDEYWAGRERLV